MSVKHQTRINGSTYENDSMLHRDIFQNVADSRPVRIDHWFDKDGDVTVVVEGTRLSELEDKINYEPTPANWLCR